ncbi:MAG TPA: putative metallopeptidase [Pyrinomonadaceae bacterium]|jgi:hypothetical protein
MQRPLPPEILIDEYEGEDFFIPSPDLDLWVRKTFLDSTSPLYNPEHEHLNKAHLGFLWTNVPNTRKMRSVAGEAEMPFFKGGAWQKHRQMMQLCEWFGGLPDFLITLDAQYAIKATNDDFCALVEHELYHCAQAVDEHGNAKFNKENGLPKFAMREHDVTEFVGVVERYGINAVANGREFVEAASREPKISAAAVAAACGLCAR